MGKPTGVEIAKCPSCGKPIGDQHPYAWCSECGEPLPDQMKALIKPRAENPLTKTDWSVKPRSALWKLTASLIWLGTCVSLLVLFLFLGYKNAQASADKDQAAWDFVQTTQKAIPITMLVMLGGVIYLCKRPKLKS